MATAVHEKEPAAKPSDHKPQNPVGALVRNPEPKDVVPGSWQDGFIQIADQMDSTGNHWLGNIFREVADPPVEEKTETSHGTVKSGKSN